MSEKPKRKRGDGFNPTPMQEDEADIVAEAEAEPDESGQLLISQEKARELGALDPASIRENRRIEAVVAKKRGNEKDVPFGTDDPLVIYDMLLRTWPASSLDVHVKRMTGSKAQDVITSRPRTGAELCAALRAFHGVCAEAEYEIKFHDSARQVYRGTGRITFPDTRPAPAQQGQPMAYQPPPGYPPGYPPPGYPYPPPAQAQQPQAAPAPAQSPPAAAAQPPQPIYVQPPPGPDMNAMFASMKQMFEMFQGMQQQLVPQPQPPQPQPQPQQFMPPPPPPPAGSDPATQMAWMAQMVELFKQMQSMAPATSARGHAAQQQPQMNPMMMAAMMGGMMPPREPPPGTVWVPGWGFVPIERLAQAVGAGAPQGPMYRGGGPHRPPSPYAPDAGAPSYGPRPYPPPPPQSPPVRERSPAEQFREAVSVIRSARNVMRELDDAIGGSSEPDALEHDGGVPPARVFDTGAGKLIYDPDDQIQWGPTIATAVPGVLKWIGEQVDAVQKAKAEQRQPSPPPRRVLPPGYVEVTPDYRPPPGFVAVAEQPPPYYPPQPPQEEELPPPPEDLPPPVSPWGMPTGDGR